MSISLVKHEPISLKKMDDSIQHIQLGIEWHTTQHNFDVDIHAFICENRDVNGQPKPQVISDEYTVFFNNQKSKDGSFWSHGDDLGGDGGGAEAIDGDLSKIDQRAVEVAFIATINKADVRHQNFGQVSGGKVFIINTDSNEELAHWDFGPGAWTNETAIHLGSLTLGDDGWEFEAIGEGGVKDFADIAVGDYGYPS
jgi:tellurium resistance protein TerD